MTLEYSFIEDFKNKEAPKIKETLFFDVLETVCPTGLLKNGTIDYKKQLLGLVKMNNNPYSSFHWKVYPEDGTEDSTNVYTGEVNNTNVEYFTFPIEDESVNYFVMITPTVVNETPVKPPADLMPAELNVYSSCGDVKSRMPARKTPSVNTQIRMEPSTPTPEKAGEPSPPFKEETYQSVKNIHDLVQENRLNPPLGYAMKRLGLEMPEPKYQSSRSTKPVFKIFYTSQILDEKYALEQDLKAQELQAAQEKERQQREWDQIKLHSHITRPVCKPMAQRYADFEQEDFPARPAPEKYESMFALNKLPISILDKSERSDSSLTDSPLLTSDEEESESN